MPSGKKKGRGNGSPKKNPITRSQTKKDRQQGLSNSLATFSSPSKVKMTKKSAEKQPSLKSPEVTGITPQVVTLPKTKQAKSSEELSINGNSTGDESVLLVTPVTMASVFDTKLEDLLTYYFMAISDQHDI